MVLFGIYHQPVVVFLIIVELILIIYFFRNELQSPTLQVFKNSWNDFSLEARSYFPILNEGEPSNNFLNQFLPVFVVSLVSYALVHFWIYVKIFFYNLGTTFAAWDVVVSWNKWALSWVANTFPVDSRFYPQLIPVTWSTVYVVTGAAEIQFFAKAVMPIFPLLLLVLMIDLWSRTKQIGYLFALVLTQLFLKKFLAQELDNGYVDVAIAFFGLLPIHAILTARYTLDNRQRNTLLALGALFAAGASITKQSGIYIFAVYPILVYISFFYNGARWQKAISFKKSLVFYAAIAIIPLSWYIFRAILFWVGADRAETSGLIEVSNAVYANVGLLAQLVSAFANFDKYIYLFLIVLIAVPLFDPLFRTITALIVIPYPFLWAWGASYDTRNLALFLPIFALTVGAALQLLIEFLFRKFEHFSLDKIKIYWIWIVLGIALLAGGYYFSNDMLQKSQTQQQLQNFSPSINEKIYAIVKQYGPQTKILTNYPMRYLPDLEKNQVQISFKDYQRFLQYTVDPEIGFMLVPGGDLDPQIDEYVKSKITDGSYRVILTDKSWVRYTLLEVMKR